MEPRFKFVIGQKVAYLHMLEVHDAEILDCMVKNDDSVSYYIHYAIKEQNYIEWVPERSILKLGDFEIKLYLEFGRKWKENDKLNVFQKVNPNPGNPFPLMTGAQLTDFLQSLPSSSDGFEYVKPRNLVNEMELYKRDEQNEEMELYKRDEQNEEPVELISVESSHDDKNGDNNDSSNDDKSAPISTNSK